MSDLWQIAYDVLKPERETTVVKYMDLCSHPSFPYEGSLVAS